MVVLDASVLLLFVEPSARPPVDPSTGKPLEKCHERIEFLIETLTAEGTRACIPTPVLSELLVRSGDSKGEFLETLTSSSAFVVASFNEKAAIELAFLLDASGKAAKKKLSDRETWAKLKFDRQIVAIAKVNNVTRIFTDDVTLGAVAKANGIEVTHTWELPLPPVKAQQELDFKDSPVDDEK